jgi:cobyrinic acid a,c-diamide synthase
MGGGYPEIYAAELQANKSMHESIKNIIANG